MRGYPIPYLTLLLICGVFFVAGIIGVNTTDQRIPMATQEAAFYLSWLPISVGAAVFFSFVFWIIALVHLLKNRAMDSNERLVWVVVVILLNGLGAVLYFFLAPNPGLSAGAGRIPRAMTKDFQT